MLLPRADGGYFSPRDYGTVTAVGSRGGRADRLDWEQSGQKYLAPRVGD